MDEANARGTLALEVVQHRHGDHLTEASFRSALVRLYTLLLDFNPAVLKDCLATDLGSILFG